MVRKSRPPVKRKGKPSPKAKAPAKRLAWMPVFLAHLAEYGHVTEACKAANVAPATVYERLTKDDDFRALKESAVRDAMDKLEGEVYRRAVFGVDEPVYQGGELVGHKTKYSDQLALALLRAHRPERYQPVQHIQGEVEVRHSVAETMAAAAARHRAKEIEAEVVD